MRNYLLASAFIALTGLVGTTSAQAPQQANAQVEQFEFVRMVLAQQEAARKAATCAGPGNAPVALAEEIFFDGRAYRCVEVFGPNEAPGMANAPLQKRTVGLVRVGAVQRQ